ncbi:MAG: hypothetical protein HY236_09675, partial [Acidobacteria bacterium]|nr:hypothetical protein [Acidobacteriota bacterium]
MREAASWLLDHRQTIGPAIWEVLCHLHGACSPREVHLLLGTPERTIRRHLARLRPLLAGQPQNQRPKMAAPQRPKMAATSHQRPKMAAPPIKERARARTDRQIPIPFQNQNPSVSPDFLHQLLALVPTDFAGAVKVRAAAPQLDEAQVLTLCRQIAIAAHS